MRNVACVLVLVAMSAFAAEEVKQSIQVSGEAVIYVPPDQAVINLGIESFDKDLGVAKTANTAAGAKLIKAIRDMGVAEGDIQTDLLQVQLQYRDSVASRGIEGYFVRRGYCITLKDVSKFEQLVDSALQNGANALHGFEFKTTQMRKFRDEARAKAVEAAREKARDMTAVINGVITRPVAISEANYGYYDGMSGRYWGYRGGYGANYMQNSVQIVDGGAAGGETTPLGKIGVSARVTMTFEYTVAK